jgi:hypothetical protein
VSRACGLRSESSGVGLSWVADEGINERAKVVGAEGPTHIGRHASM